MKVFNYDDMPDTELRFWLESIRKDIEERTGFRNVKALQSGAITTALKRLGELRKTTPPVIAGEKSVQEIMDSMGL